MSDQSRVCKQYLAKIQSRTYTSTARFLGRAHERSWQSR